MDHIATKKDYLKPTVTTHLLACRQRLCQGSTSETMKQKELILDGDWQTL